MYGDSSSLLSYFLSTAAERSMMKENLGRRTTRGALPGIHSRTTGKGFGVLFRFGFFPLFFELELHEGFVN